VALRLCLFARNCCTPSRKDAPGGVERSISSIRYRDEMLNEG
jgi:hypothetical protein